MKPPNRSSRVVALLLFVGCLLVASPATAARILYIQPLGKRLPDADVALVQKALHAFYAVTIKVLPRQPLPKAAWYKPRRRYRADKLLDFLRKRSPKDAFRILGLTAVDISTTKGKIYDWGILGLATLDGRVSVISRFRCRRGARSKKHTRIRLAKVAVHEIGHNLGLDHCPTRGCLMEDARGTVKTTDREHDLCHLCRKQLLKSGYRIVAQPKIPWPAPKKPGKKRPR